MSRDFIARWIALWFGLAVSTDLPAQPGTLDPSFVPALNDGAAVYVVTLQTNGDILIGGSFTCTGGVSVTNVARLRPDGSLDETFNPASAADIGYVDAIAVQADGKVVIGGNFASSTGATSANLTRLNADGSVDEDFAPGLVVDAPVNAVALQTDGKILLGGSFVLVDFVLRRSIARLNADGTLDFSFDACVASSAGAGATALSLQTDGRILVSGNFTFSSGLTREGVARLGHNGDLDLTYASTPGVNSGAVVFALALRTNGAVLLSGDFESFNFTTRIAILQLGAVGELDPNFDPGTGLALGTTLYAMTRQSDEKILIAGDFTQYNGQNKRGVARFHTNGSLDASFDAGLGPDNSVSSFAMQSNGRILIAGRFGTFDGVARNGLARLKGDPLPARLVAPVRPVNGSFALQLFGEEQGHYEVQASSNFVDWVSVTNFTAPSAVVPLVDSDVGPHPKRFYRAITLP
jgi:uncharacterized delta-60 repeat protein